MADETEDTDQTEDVDQSKTVDEDKLPTELPDDPVALRELAQTAITRVNAAAARESELLSEKGRLEDDLEEQRTNAKVWSERAIEAMKLGKTDPAPNEKPKSEEKGLDDTTELAVAVTEGLTLGDLRRMARAEAQREVKQATDDLSKQGQVGNAMTAEYPDLRDSNSALAKATVAEMGKIEGVDDATKFELASRRAAARLGIAPKTTSTAKDKENGNAADQRNRERLRNAQPARGEKRGAGKGAIVVTDADRANFRTLNGGQDVPDDVIKRGKQFDQERQQQRQTRA